MPNTHTHEFTANNFDDDALGADTPVLVDFWAEWCPPCRALGPTIDSIAEELSGRARVGKLDVDAHGEIAARYELLSIPTVILFSGGEEIARFVGVQSKETLVNAIESALASAPAQ